MHALVTTRKLLNRKRRKKKDSMAKPKAETSARIDPELQEELDAMVRANPGTSKTQAMNEGLRWWLKKADKTTMQVPISWVKTKKWHDKLEMMLNGEHRNSKEILKRLLLMADELAAKSGSHARRGAPNG